jgi:Phytanoyl-CoA dioxygenase (PhyH)
MMLTDDQVQQYHRDGYIVPNFTVPQATLDEIKALHTKLIEREPQFRDYCPALLEYDAGFLGYCNNQAILDMVAQLIGPNIALWNTSFFAKPAGNGKRTPWHQDGEYWPIRPLATCTAWLALDDSTPENGCLRVIKGSHTARALKAHNTLKSDDVTLTQELKPSEYNEADAADIILRAGQISLHDVYLLHGSEANSSPKPRRGMTMRFMPTTSLFDRQLAQQKSVQMSITDHSGRDVYLMRGADVHGGNQLLTMQAR